MACSTWHASHEPNPWLISPHALLPLLTLLHGCALALVVGYRPRLAALVGRLFSGLAQRTTAVTAGDEALRSLLFLAFAFQPPALPLSIFSLGLAAHLVCIHVTSAALKRDREWATGEWATVMTLLHVTTHAKRNAAVELRRSPSLCQLLTHGALALETWGSWLLLVLQPALRTAALVAFAALHVGVFATLDVGLYSPAMVAALVVGEHRRRSAGRSPCAR